MSNRTARIDVPVFFPTLVFIAIFIVLLALLMPESEIPQQAVALQQTETPAAVVALPSSTPPPPTAAPTTEQVASYDAALVFEGQGIVQSVCSACHGLDARGITGLGKDMLNSPFVQSLTDEELFHFIATGRDTSDPLNTTGIPMPPRGGNPSLTDDQLHAIIAYLRTESISNSSVQAVPTSAPTNVVSAPSATPAPSLEAPILPTSIPVTPQPFTAQTAYAWSCSSCHGIDGSGNPLYAESFLDSPLLDDPAQIVNLLSVAAPPEAPGAAFAHPYRGGYPALSDEQLAALADYVVSLGAP